MLGFHLGTSFQKYEGPFESGDGRGKDKMEKRKNVLFEFIDQR